MVLLTKYSQYVNLEMKRRREGCRYIFFSNFLQNILKIQWTLLTTNPAKSIALDAFCSKDTRKRRGKMTVKLSLDVLHVGKFYTKHSVEMKMNNSSHYYNSRSKAAINIKNTNSYTWILFIGLWPSLVNLTRSIGFKLLVHPTSVSWHDWDIKTSQSNSVAFFSGHI